MFERHLKGADFLDASLQGEEARQVQVGVVHGELTHDVHVTLAGRNQQWSDRQVLCKTKRYRL